MPLRIPPPVPHPVDRGRRSGRAALSQWCGADHTTGSFLWAGKAKNATQRGGDVLRVTLELQDNVPTLERGNDQNLSDGDT